MKVIGIVRNGVIVPKDSTILPEGIEVIVEVQDKEEIPTIYERFKDIIGVLELPPEYARNHTKLNAWIGNGADLPEDLAKNHDHYLHGQPKR